MASVPATVFNTRDRLKRLPAFPPVAARLLSLLSNQSADLQEIAGLASGDATICGRLLQHANSVEFARSAPAVDLLFAVSALGIDRTREIIAMVATASFIQTAGRTEQLRRSWTHMTATAIAADEIARTCGVHVYGAYTAGLLHDIGRLGLLVAYPQQYEQLLNDAADRCLDVLDFERECFGADHAEVGCWLAEQWNLPDEFKVIAGRHHDPSEGTDLDLLRIVHVACRLADHFGYYVTRPLREDTYEEVVAELPPPHREKLLSSGVPKALEAKLRTRIAELDEGSGPPVAEVPGIEEEGVQDPEVEGLVTHLRVEGEAAPQPRYRIAAATALALLIVLCCLWLATKQ